MKMRFMITLVAAIGLASSALADTPILENPGFDGTEGWRAGSNSFIGGIWQAFILDGYTVDDRVNPQGENLVYTSWDDEKSDRLENYLYQEWGAGPTGSPTETEFSAGDVFVFKGMASATRTGTNTSDVTIRAFIKMLGYNENQWAFQVKPAYTVYHDIGSAMEPFELTVTFPDLAVDDSFQTIQMGLEISTNYDSSSNSMDAGTIIFSNLEGYIVGDGGNTWNGYEVLDGGWVDTDSWMGWINVTDDPYIISSSLNGWIYLPTGQNTDNGGWAYFPR